MDSPMWTQYFDGKLGHVWLPALCGNPSQTAVPISFVKLCCGSGCRTSTYRSDYLVENGSRKASGNGGMSTLILIVWEQVTA